MDQIGSKRDVVAIGGSLGAVEAVKQLCSKLPANFSAAVFVTIHVGSHGQNLLAGIFDEVGPLPVVTAQDGDPVTPGCIRIAPADRHLLVIDGLVRLGRGPRENMARPAIDPLFRSVAVEYGPRAIGVVLTGLLDDGAAGLADIKRCGGLTVVQSPTEAMARDMPLEALGASDVDYMATLHRLPALLDTLTAEPAGLPIEAGADLRLEVEIALGRPCDDEDIRKIGDPVAISCPTCGGVLSQIRRAPLRFRCQVGHCFSSQSLESAGEGAADEAVRVALRILHERMALSEKMAEEARRSGRPAAAAAIEKRAEEYGRNAGILERALEGE